MSDYTIDAVDQYHIIHRGESNFLTYLKVGRSVQVQLFRDIEPLTAQITLSQADELKTSRKAKVFRDCFVEEHGERADKELEQVVRIIQENVRTYREQIRAKENNIPHEEEIDEQIEAEVDALIAAPSLLDALKPYLDALIAGEDDNKQSIFILLTGGRAGDVTLKTILLLKGEAGGGKSTLMRLANRFNTKSVTRFTEHALEYSDIEHYDVLKINELGYMDVENERHSLSNLKFLSMDDKGFTVEYTVRDEETGRFTTAQNTIPPMTVISSTTRTQLDPQLDRRAFIFSPDESDEQTERIRLWKAHTERERGKVALGLLSETSEHHAERVLRAFVNRLEPVHVILPFPSALMSILKTEKLRIRGDYDKIMALVKLYAFANQHKLPKIQTENDVPTILVTPHLALEILKLATAPLTVMMTGLETRLTRLIDILIELKTERAKKLNAESAEDFAENILLGKINDECIIAAAKRLHRSKQTIQRYLKQCCASGWISETRSLLDGRKKVYVLLYELEEIKSKIGMINFEKTPDEHLEKFRIEARNWLRDVLPQLANKDGQIRTDIMEWFR